MIKHIDRLRAKVNKTKWGVRFGSDYVVAAEPIREENPPKEDKIFFEGGKEYFSAVQQQNEVFPILGAPQIAIDNERFLANSNLLAFKTCLGSLICK